MKLRRAVLRQYQHFLKYALPIAVICFICTYFSLKTEQQIGESLLFLGVARFSPLNIFIFLFTACGFREQNRLLAQFGFSREKAFLSFLCVLPVFILTGLFQFGSAAFSAKVSALSAAEFSFSFDVFNPLSVEERGVQLTLAVLFALFAALLGYFVGAVVYYANRAVRIALIPLSLVGLYGLFVAAMTAAEGGFFVTSAYATLFWGENTAFPAIRTLVVNSTGILLLLNGDWLLTRSLPIR